jgi:chaperonin GroES
MVQRTKTPTVPLLEDDALAAAQPGLGFTATAEAPPLAASEAVMQTDGSALFEIDEAPLEPEVVEQEDGSALVVDPPEAEKPEAKTHLANLAGVIEAAEASRIARRLLDAVERDKEDRKERDEQYAEALQRTGLGKEAPGGANFQGASRVVHPMLTEACVDFAARTMKEVFPPKGPVKTQIIGTATREKTERAERKKTYMNWQCTKQIRELRSSFETMLTQVPLGGSQYLKMWYDERVERPRAEFLPVDKMLLPYAATDLYSAERKTHVQDITRDEFNARVESELYIEIPTGESGMVPEPTAAERANDRVEGRSDNSQNDDGLRRLFEIYVMLDLEIDGADRLRPYIATIDETSGRLVALYRNWKEGDDKFEELDWIVEAKFVPWRGAYGIGIIHIAGSLSAGATGALRALLDSAHINNFPGSLALKGTRMAGQNTSVEPTQVTQIEGPATVDDIRKIAMPMPFNPPNPVLFQLLEYMVQSGKGVLATADEKIADASANTPVGTTLALIEQGSVAYSSVHSRMHQTMERLLVIMHRIDSQFLDDEVTVEELGELVVSRRDFQGPMDVVPVSDPNIFSETQRYAQLQAVLQLRAQFAPGSFKEPALLEQAMRLLNYPQYEDVLNTPLDAEERNAVEENFVASNPQAQLEAYDPQDHLAHLQAHVKFMASPIFCANPLMANPALPKLMEHCREHLRMYYRENMRAAARSVQAQAAAFPDLKGDDSIVAAASSIVDEQMAGELGPIMQALQQLQQQMAQLIPPPPDPEAGKEQIKAQSAQAIERVRQDGETARAQQRVQAEQAEAQARAAMEAQAEQMRVTIEQGLAQMREQAAASRHTEEMALAARNASIAEFSEQNKQRLEAAEKRFAEIQETLRNTQDNQTLVIVEQIKGLLAAAQPQPGKDGEAEKAGDKAAIAQLAELQSQIAAALQQLMTAQTTPRNFTMRRGPDGALFLNQQ